MKSYKKSIFMGVAFGIYFSMYFLSKNEDVYFWHIIVNSSFGIQEISYDRIIQLTVGCFPIFIFLIVFGTDIYKHFCSASVYIFIRCKKRSKWFFKEIILLLINTIIFVILIPITSMIVTFIKNKVIIDKDSLILFAYYVLIYSLMLFSMALMINVLSIKVGTIKAYAAVISILMCFIMLLFIWIEIFPLEGKISYLEVMANGELLKYNLFTHFVLCWHSSFFETLNSKINLYGINYDLNISVMVAFVFSFISVVIGYTIVREIDFIKVNNELEN